MIHIGLVTKIICDIFHECRLFSLINIGVSLTNSRRTCKFLYVNIWYFMPPGCPLRTNETSTSTWSDRHWHDDDVEPQWRRRQSGVTETGSGRIVGPAISRDFYQPQTRPSSFERSDSSSPDPGRRELQRSLVNREAKNTCIVESQGYEAAENFLEFFSRESAFPRNGLFETYLGRTKTFMATFSRVHWSRVGKQLVLFWEKNLFTLIFGIVRGSPASIVDV
ncbi:unnamed protein product [Nesidiocoris tenuis]|uniref:Uncharacterized protein n=1 Tax=Nesidiocoris tenuis TaxID=355587 RepID=A0A6H5HWF8_9HEMI|nr:unnamed protein product [Nesidiocoris tenuis]